MRPLPEKGLAAGTPTPFFLFMDTRDKTGGGDTEMPEDNNRRPAGGIAIECRGITKSFGTVVANDGIDLSVRYGEILALLGKTDRENHADEHAVGDLPSRRGQHLHRRA